MKKLILLLIVVFITGALIYIIRVDEDEWICENGQWIMHGRPASPKPTTGCGFDAIIPPSPFPKTLALKIYFGKENNDEEGIECKAMSPVTRDIPYTLAAEKEAIDELLKGPTETEIKDGYFSSINKGVILQKISIKDGNALVDFDEQLEKGTGGSCKVSFIRSQIVNTLKQFPTVKDVVISINGKVEDILQP